MLSNMSAPPFQQTETVCGECHKLPAKLLAYTTSCVNTNGPRRLQHRRWGADPGAWGELCSRAAQFMTARRYEASRLVAHPRLRRHQISADGEWKNDVSGYSRPYIGDAGFAAVGLL